PSDRGHRRAHGQRSPALRTGSCLGYGRSQDRLRNPHDTAVLQARGDALAGGARLRDRERPGVYPRALPGGQGMSSIDWLGEVNPSWGYAPLFTLGSPKKKSNKGMLESNLLSLSYGRIIRRNIESSDGLVPASYETYQIVEPGDTVLRFTDLQNDQRSLRSGLVEERGIITSAYLSFTPDRRRLNPAFFAHMMRAVDLSKVFYRMGSGVRQSLNWGEFSLMRLPLPPLETQQRIAGYLDRETAEIDAAVADLDKYVELLELRARTLIKQQLSGDHPQVKMGLLADAIIGITYSPNDVVEEGGTKVYRSGNVQDSRINRQN